MDLGDCQANKCSHFPMREGGLLKGQNLPQINLLKLVGPKLKTYSKVDPRHPIVRPF